MNKNHGMDETLFEAMPHPLISFDVVLDEDGTPIKALTREVNRAFEEAMGVSKSSVMGKSMAQIFPDLGPEAKPCQVIDRVYGTGEDYSFYHYDQGGQPLFQITAFTSAQGCITALFHPVHENKAEQRETMGLGLNQEQMDSILQAIPDLISIHDLDYNIVYSNWKGFGAIPEDKRVLFSKCYATYRDNEDICPDCQVNTVLATKEEARGEMSLPDGTWVEFHSIPIFDAQGELRFFMEWVRDTTGKKETESYLREQCDLLEGIINGIPDILAIQHTDHTIERYNTAGYRSLNKTHDEVKGRRCYELIGREKECPQCASKKAMETKGLQHVERYVPELDRYFDCYSNPVLDQDGTVLRIVEQLRDITDEKKREKMLRESQEHLNTLITHTPAVIYSYSIIDGKPLVTYVNENANNVLGYKPEELTGSMEFWFQCVHPEDLHVLKGKLQGQEEIMEYRFQGKDGSYRWLADRQKVVSKEGETLEVVGTWWDRTDGKKAEEELIRYAEEQTLLLDTIETQIWYLKDSNTYGSANRAHADFLGLSPEDMEHKALQDVFMNLDEVAQFMLNNEKVFQKKQTLRTEEWLTRRDGVQRLLSITRTPKLGQNNTVEYVVCCAEDSTELKEAGAIIEEQKQKIENLHDVALEMKLCKDEQAICDLTIRAAETILNFSHGSVGLLEGDWIRNWTTSQGLVQRSMHQTQGLAGQTLQRGTTIIVDDIQESQWVWLSEPRFRGAISAPVGDLGVFQAFSNQALAFSEEDGEILELLLSHTFSAIKEIRLQREEREKEYQYRTLLTETHNVVLLIDAQGTCQEANPAALAFFESSLEELKQHKIKDFVLQDSSQDIKGSMEVPFSIQGKEKTLILNVIPFGKDDETWYYAIGNDITDRIRSEEALRASEEKYRLFFKHNPLGVVHIDNKGLITDCNVPFVEIIGSTREAIIGLNTLFLPDERIRSIIQAALQGEVRNFEGIYESITSGKKTQARALFTPIYTGKDSISGAIGIVEDISERKQAEEALRASEEYNRSMIEVIPDLILRASRNGIILDAIASEEEFLFQPRDTLLDHQVHDILPPETAHLFQSGIEKGIKDDELQLIEYQLTVPAGVLWFEARIFPLGNQEEVLCLIRDITESKQAEKALKESESRLRKITDSALDAVIMMDGEGCISFWNPAAESIFGYEKEEVIGKKLHEFLAPERYRPLFYKAFPQFKKTGEGNAVNRIVELEACHKDGREIPVELSLGAFQIGDVWHAVGVLRDITEQKKVTKKLSEYNKELELKNEELELVYHRLNEEINKARNIHEKTLPSQHPDIEGISMSSFYQPAETLGGDFYNVIREGDTLIFYLSDVTGHGLEGALVSAFVKEAIDSYLSLQMGTISPENILRHLCRQYQRENYPDDYFVAIFLGVLDLQTFTLTYTGAGWQENILVQNGSGQQFSLSAEGLPISNVLSWCEMEYPVNSLQVDPGSTILLHTDGLTENASEDRLYYKKEDLFFAHSHLPPEVIKEIILEDFYWFNGESLQGQDDITMLLLQRETEEKERHSWQLRSHLEGLQRVHQDIYPILSPRLTEDIVLEGFHELVVNAMEHGNQWDKEKLVTIQIAMTKTYILAIITDEGEGFDWRQMKKDREMGRGDLEHERGRGIIMAQGLGYGLYYNGKGNTAYFVLSC